MNLTGWKTYLVFAVYLLVAVFAQLGWAPSEAETGLIDSFINFVFENPATSALIATILAWIMRRVTKTPDGFAESG